MAIINQAEVKTTFQTLSEQLAQNKKAAQLAVAAVQANSTVYNIINSRLSMGTYFFEDSSRLNTVLEHNAWLALINATPLRHFLQKIEIKNHGGLEKCINADAVMPDYYLPFNQDSLEIIFQNTTDEQLIDLAKQAFLDKIYSYYSQVEFADNKLTLVNAKWKLHDFLRWAACLNVISFDDLSRFQSGDTDVIAHAFNVKEFKVKIAIKPNPKNKEAVSFFEMAQQLFSEQDD